MVKAKGKFIKSLIAFIDKQGHSVSSESQARLILDTAGKLVTENGKGVLITYSANFEQTVKIEKTYSEGNWLTNTGGDNQAATIAAMEKQMGSDEYKHLQGTMRIAPITTMTYIRTSSKDSTGFDNRTHIAVLTQDMDRIKSNLDNGWDVLGWVNQKTDPEYAVGGGVANSQDLDHPGQIKFPKELQTYVRDTLISFEKAYAGESENA